MYASTCVDCSMCYPFACVWCVLVHVQRVGVCFALSFMLAYVVLLDICIGMYYHMCWYISCWGHMLVSYAGVYIVLLVYFGYQVLYVLICVYTHVMGSTLPRSWTPPSVLSLRSPPAPKRLSLLAVGQCGHIELWELPLLLYTQSKYGAHRLRPHHREPSHEVPYSYVKVRGQTAPGQRKWPGAWQGCGPP